MRHYLVGAASTEMFSSLIGSFVSLRLLDSSGMRS